MDLLQTQFIYAAMGIIQALISVVLWFIVYYRSGHRGGWLIVPFLPLIGMVLTPILLGLIYNDISPGPNGLDTMPIVMSIVIFLISIIPLVVLAIRLLNGKLRLQSVLAADVFGDR